MKKNYEYVSILYETKKLLLIMKLTTVLILLMCMQTYAKSYAQTKKFSFSMKDVSVEEIIDHLENESDYHFFMKQDKTMLDKKVNVKYKDASIQLILDDLLKDTQFTYKVVDNYVAIVPVTKNRFIGQQNKRITGKVTDTNGEGLPGVSVVVKGTTVGITTDIDGNYELEVLDNAKILQFSFVGMKSQEVEISEQTQINVVMQEDAIGLEEVVAIGYGVQKKVNLTGSVATAQPKDLVKRPVMQTSSALQGLMPGVTVRVSSGKPGADGGSINIRGVTSLSNSNPLVLIDNVPSNINNIDPSEIESLTVLKDASSASIYGSRAAAGVILIKTKRGGKGKLKVNYNGSFGWQDFTTLPEYSDGLTYMEKYNEARSNMGLDPFFASDYIEQYKLNKDTDPYHYPDTDWQEEMYTGSGFQQHHSVTISGGSEKLSTMLSLSAKDQEGIIPLYGFNKYTVRTNNDLKVSDVLNIRLDIAGSKSNQQQSANDGDVYGINRTPPIEPLKTPTGHWAMNSLGGHNNLSNLYEGGTKENWWEKFRGTLGVNIKPVKGLEIDLSYSPEFETSQEKTFKRTHSSYNVDDEDLLFPYTYPAKASLNHKMYRTQKNNYLGLITYSKQFKEHSLKILLGTEHSDYFTEYLTGYRENYPFEDYQVINAGKLDNQSTTGSASEYALSSYFGRINYDINGKYLFEANTRYDGSSRFRKAKRWGVFPSFSFGWRLSEENFMKDIAWMSNLKLRATWGELGNQQGGYYPYISTVNTSQDFVLNGAIVNGATLTALANEDLKWETTTTSNLGLDVGILDGKINASFDYYVKKSTDILLTIPIPKIVGMSAPYQNAGELENKGWDFNVSYKGKINQVKINASATLSDVKNKVIDLKGTGPWINGDYITEEGAAINSFYVYENIGIFQSQEEIDNHAKQFGTYGLGDLIYKDQLTEDTDNDGVADAPDGVINSKDRVRRGHGFPRYTFGVNFDLEYKNFDFAVFLQGVGKRSTLMTSEAVVPFYNGGKIQTWQEDAWRSDNTDAAYPKLFIGSSHNNFYSSDRYLYDSSYLRIKNITIGYTLPKSSIKRFGIDRLRFSLTVNNLATFSSMHKGFDPEFPSGRGYSYAPVRTTALGVNLVF